MDEKYEENPDSRRWKRWYSIISLFKETKRMKICAIVDKDPNAPAMKLAEEMNVHTSTEWKEWIHHNIDIVVNVTGEEDLFEKK